jgi:hypothetical protein
MTRDSSDLTNCFVGVSFYRSTDNETLQTAVAQIFNERGDGVTVVARRQGSPRTIASHICLATTLKTSWSSRSSGSAVNTGRCPPA